MAGELRFVEQADQQLLALAAEQPLDQIADEVVGDFIERAQRLIRKWPLRVGLLQKPFVAQNADERGDGGVGQLAAGVGQLVANVGCRGARVSPLLQKACITSSSGSVSCPGFGSCLTGML